MQFVQLKPTVSVRSQWKLPITPVGAWKRSAASRGFRQIVTLEMARGGDPNRWIYTLAGKQRQARRLENQ